MGRVVRIAMAQSSSGKVAVCGPNYRDGGYSSPMDAALCWLIEAGEVPTDRFWLTVTVPDPSENEIDLDADLSIIPSPTTDREG